MVTNCLRVTDAAVRLPTTISAAGKLGFTCNDRCPCRHRPTERGQPGRERPLGTLEVPMRTPSRAALALAMGVFTTTGLTAVAATSATAAPAHPSIARPVAAPHSTHSVRLSLPGTGVRLTASVDDEGNVTDTSAGDDDGDEVS